MVLMMVPYVKDGTDGIPMLGMVQKVLMMVPHVKDGTDGSDDGSPC